MKRIVLILAAIICGLNVFAQNSTPNKGKITGKVTDAATKAPVDYATVGIYKQGSASPFNGASTDPKGNFKIDNIAPGEYTITVDFLGYKRLTLEHLVISDAATSLSLGNLLLSSVQSQLKGVVITANAPTVENKIDKLVYNPANDLTAQGGVALDVLKKVPMITVDIDGNVELMGNANIRFLINGKPSGIFGASLSDALQSIPASQIKNIEVITSPGAKYDAAGTGGIVNIVLKDSKVQGINGSVNLSAGTRLQNGAFNINARKGNFGVNAFFSGNEQLNSTAINTSDRTSYNTARDTVTHLFQKGSSNFKRTGYQSGFSINWDITPKDQLTAALSFNHFGNHSNGTTNIDQAIFSPLNNPLADTMSLSHSNSRFGFNSKEWSLAYKKTFNKEGQELNVLYSATYGSNTNNYSLEQDYLNANTPATGSISNNPGRDNETDIAVDYSQPVTKNFTIETGAKAVIENLNNSVVTQALLNGVYVPNPFQTYSFNYKRNIFAYYLSTSFSLFNNFIDGKAGLRYEHTSSSTDFPNTTIPSYGIFAPSFVLSHKLDKTETIKFSYTYRLERPEYRDLNPFYNISDPHNISTGNPNLKPELGHNFELGYNKSFNKGANIYIAAFYRYNTDDLQSFTTFYPTLKIGDSTYNNVSLNQRYNIGREATTGINLYGSLPITGKLSIRSNMFFADRITNNPGSPQVSGFTYRINLNASYQFADDLAAEFFVNYRSSQKGIQGTNPAFAFYNLAVRKQFLNKKASIGLTAANPFSQYVTMRSTTFGGNFDQSNTRQVPFRSFGISLSYKFGKLEFKKDKERDDNNAPVPGENGG
ncbi:outer membrane beta-barrel family protein [Mucilaginibacter xinganensis]|uniref:Ferric enterobactin receptor n=1 Tax=Mucilaginibacter xinganensis TaxID=1234841 RepID=A0A223NSY3_9SPHI|nr:outer membrane beta-barrel family protein [Mucilaginibacter xinganensis]ASU32963.1 Ferric enterobactin receptor precursor [Mucilaginibacter xinganensis]